MPYELVFHPGALREWRQLIEGIRAQFKKKLKDMAELERAPTCGCSVRRPYQRGRPASLGQP